MSAPPKYLFVNGVMKLNPAYSSTTSGPSSTPPDSLAVVSSMSDIAAATESQAASTGAPMQLSESTVASLEIMQDGGYAQGFNSPQPMDGSSLLDGLTNLFATYEVPIGLLNKLLVLQMYRLWMIIDDSGSMKANSDVLLKEGTPHILRGARPDNNTYMTRWQEAENRLHVLVDILAYVPTVSITITFLNAPNVISLTQHGKTQQQFMAEAHGAVSHTFSVVEVRYRTPTHRVLSQAFQAAAASPEPTCFYLFTDGVPSDAPVEAVADLVKRRPNPDRSPLTLLSCTNEDSEVEWMKQLEEAAPFTSEIDDFNDERNEVLKDQGQGFPYTKGFWLISQLVSAINPNDLDAMDENLPFTCSTLSNLLGRKLTNQEYVHYFERNPHGALYVNEFGRFRDEEVFARSIISKPMQEQKERAAGYVNGERPDRPLQAIGHLIGGGLPTPPSYGGAPPAYGAPPPAYGAPPGAQGGVPAYGSPPPAVYGSAPPAYGAPPTAYGAPPPAQGAAYGAPPPAYGAPPPAYGAPPPAAYGAPSAPPAAQPAAPPAYSDAPPAYGAPPS